MMDIGKILVPLRLFTMPIWVSQKSQSQISGNFIFEPDISHSHRHRYRHLWCWMFDVAFMIDHPRFTLNLDTYLLPRCLMLMSPIVLLVKGVSLRLENHGQCYFFYRKCRNMIDVTLFFNEFI